MSTYKINSQNGVKAEIKTAEKRIFRVPGNLRGPKGATGGIGPEGPVGPEGPSNTLAIGTVTDGPSADATITGVSPNQELNLVLPKGDKGDTGDTGSAGADGESAYQIAVDNGFIGTEEEWLDSLVGPEGPDGPQGPQGPIGIGTPTGGADGQVLTKQSNADYDFAWETPSGAGDMLASVYDPTNKAADAFSMDNMVETSTKKILSNTERSKLSGIEAGADVTDAANVGAAGAFMKSVDDMDDITDGATYKKYSNTEKTKLAGIEAGADVTDATNVDAAGATMNSDTTLAGNGYFLDEDDFASNSATKVPSQQSVKAYVDNFVPDASNGFTLGEIPSGTIDGSNAVFTTSDPYISGDLVVYVEGIRQIRGVDYTETTPASGVFTFTTPPLVGYAVSVDYIRNINAGTTDADTVDGYHASTFLEQLATGLIPANETWTFSSWDSVTRIGIITVPSNATTKYSAGMRVKMTLATNGVMWGLIQSVTSTTLTVFFQSGVTFANQVISGNYYSLVKNPQNFPADPNNWKLEFVSTTDYSTAANTGQWYKLDSSLQLKIPAGAWNLYYQVTSYGVAGGTKTDIKVHSALSTSSSSVSDGELEAANYVFTSTVDTKRFSAANLQRSKLLTLAADTIYHLLVKMTGVNGTLDIRANADPDTVIRAVNAYL